MKVFLESRIHKQISSNPFSKAGAILMGPFLRRMRRVFDYSEYGGAPLSRNQRQLCYQSWQILGESHQQRRQDRR